MVPREHKLVTLHDRVQFTGDTSVVQKNNILTKAKVAEVDLNCLFLS
jgi:hypothetical protein